MKPYETRRTPVIEGWNGTPVHIHWHRATEAAPGVKVGDVLMDDYVTEESATHILVSTYTLEALDDNTRTTDGADNP